MRTHMQSVLADPQDGLKAEINGIVGIKWKYR